MKKMWTTKTLSCMAALLAVTMVTACSKNGTESSSVPAKEEQKPKLTKLTYFSLLDNNIAASVKSVGETEVAKELEKRTGVKVEYQHPPAGGGPQIKQQFNLMVASNSFTDVIEYSFTKDYEGGPDKAISDGVIIDLKPMLEKYAPNYWKILKENPSVMKQVTTDGGKIYSINKLNMDPNQLTFYGPGIRKDWLDKLGLQAPTTIDEWYTVLKAFKEKDPNGNGKADEIPFSFFMSDLESSSLFLGAYGIPMKFYQEDNKVKYGMLQPQFKEFLTQMSKWYKEGLIDPEFAVNDRKMFDAKMTGDRTGSSVYLLGGGIGKFNTLMRQTNPKFNLVGVPLPTLKQGDKPLYGHRASEVGPGASISTSNKNPEETLKWLDYRYSPEGSLLFNFGIEGESYKMVNGYPTFTDLVMKNPQGLTVAGALGKYASIAESPRLSDQRFFEQYSLPAQEQKDAIKLWSAPSNKNQMPPNLSPSLEDSAKYATIMSDVNTYTQEMITKFIMGAEPMENYDNFIKKLKSIGAEDAVKIMQSALDRFNKR
ncbi:extracellular solute-binding protein [Paenibacillus qinlingensis]|uniref:Aldouronate transport system substrate-binding protein n=1 Tax=Paenibacillus qinlingensis TaxID=1837343 RepID=A0ABU1NWM8_9BACL|nr:extracellular solute-binding protein [Paenibacillus qinlingensis]MDR6551858.1 putative aldouronate transport system substrate-binding protein [Paenibacillus qinlingensis]